MNEFERAQARTEKREQRKTLTLTKPFEEIITVPKEKSQSIDGVIKVTVILPYETFELTFTKPNVMGMKRLTKADFHRAIVEGLRPILGTVR